MKEGNQGGTNVPQAGIDDPSHFCHTPLDDIAKVLVVDIVVLSADRTLCALFELVLAVSVWSELAVSDSFGRGRRTYVLTRPALSRTVTNFVSSFS